MPVFINAPLVPGPIVSDNYLSLVNNILMECGERPVTTLVTPSVQTTLVMHFLNYTQRDIFSNYNWRFSQNDYTFAPQDTVADYPLPTDIDHLAADPKDKDYQFRPLHIDELDSKVPDSLSVAGNPTYYALWENAMRLYPVPNANYCLLKLIIGTDGLSYVCTRRHTSTVGPPGERPITGIFWQRYWALELVATAGTAWAAGTEYLPGVTLRYHRRPVDMTADASVPDMPDKYIEVLKIGTRARFKEYLADKDATLDYALYEQKLKMLKRHERREQGPIVMRPYR